MRSIVKLVVSVAAVLSLAGLAGAAQAGTTTTTTGLGSSVNPSNVNQSTTLTATVTSSGAAGCAGTVTFNNGATPLTCTGGNQTITSTSPTTFTATCVASFASAGPQTLTAAYNTTNGNCSASTSGPVTQTVNPAAPAPVPTLAGWAAYLLTALLLGGGLWFMSRRNRGSLFPSA